MDDSTARVIARSVHPEGGLDLITVEATYPSCIHKHVLTHRQFSRNTSSNRAIPILKNIQRVIDRPYVPKYWPINKSGMQPAGYLEQGDPVADKLEAIWLRGLHRAIADAREMQAANCHKERVNNILSPYQFTTCIITATDWANFFETRIHKDAQRETQELATAIKQAIDNSEPTPRIFGWHMPYILPGEVEAAQHFGDAENMLLKISVARCARVSYLNHDGKYSTLEEDVRLCNMLYASRPMHLSPTEHQAFPDEIDNNGVWLEPRLHGNFTGWCQNRKFLEGRVA